ncbi:MAG: hypothetical protein RR533_04515 [Carnobacterium sp.]
MKEVFQVMGQLDAELMIRRKLAEQQFGNINDQMTLTRTDDDLTDNIIFKSSVAILSVEYYKELKVIEKEFYRLTELLGRNTREDDSNE